MLEFVKKNPWIVHSTTATDDCPSQFMLEVLRSGARANL